MRGTQNVPRTFTINPTLFVDESFGLGWQIRAIKHILCSWNVLQTVSQRRLFNRSLEPSHIDVTVTVLFYVRRQNAAINTQPQSIRLNGVVDQWLEFLRRRDCELRI